VPIVYTRKRPKTHSMPYRPPNQKYPIEITAPTSEQFPHLARAYRYPSENLDRILSRLDVLQLMSRVTPCHASSRVRQPQMVSNKHVDIARYLESHDYDSS
jgi:hypothetical protein